MFSLLAVTSLAMAIGELRLCVGQQATTTTTTTTTTATTSALSTTTESPAPRVKVATLNSIIRAIHLLLIFPFPGLGAGFHISSGKPQNPVQLLGDTSQYKPGYGRLALLTFNM